VDPTLLTPGPWDELSRALVNLTMFVGLVVTAALAFLCGHAIVPSLIATRDVPPQARLFRWIFYPLSAVCLVPMLYALAQALSLIVGVLQRFFPRFVI
jgi:hypothetical protein